MIRFVTGPRASGVGLVRYILKRGGLGTGDLPDSVAGFDPEPDKTYVGSVTAWWLKDFPDDSIVIVRCPMTALLTVFDQESKRLGRRLINEEMEFYTSVAVRQVAFVNVAVFQYGVRFFAIRPGFEMQHRLEGLIKLITGRDDLVGDGDADSFFAASERKVYKDTSFVSSKVMSEARKMGGMYKKLNLDMEIWS